MVNKVFFSNYSVSKVFFFSVFAVLTSSSALFGLILVHVLMNLISTKFQSNPLIFSGSAAQ